MSMSHCEDTILLLDSRINSSSTQMRGCISAMGTLLARTNDCSPAGRFALLLYGKQIEEVNLRSWPGPAGHESASIGVIGRTNFSAAGIRDCCSTRDKGSHTLTNTKTIVADTLLGLEIRFVLVPLSTPHHADPSDDSSNFLSLLRTHHFGGTNHHKSA
jgi:hypothetical protein